MTIRDELNQYTCSHGVWEQIKPQITQIDKINTH